MPWKEILATLDAIRVLCPTPVRLTIQIHDAALRITEQTGHHIYDSLVIAALESGCDTLYSEDMRHGHAIEGLAIQNPFR